MQWLFPTDERSKFDKYAPVLTAELQRVFAGDASLRREMRLNFEQFLNFVDLEAAFEANGSVTVARAIHFQDRFWSKLHQTGPPLNPKWLYTSRVLRSLGLTGLRAEQQSLHQFLVLLMSGRDCGDTLSYWREAAQAVGSC